VNNFAVNFAVLHDVLYLCHVVVTADRTWTWLWICCCGCCFSHHLF